MQANKKETSYEKFRVCAGGTRKYVEKSTNLWLLE